MYPITSFKTLHNQFRYLPTEWHQLQSIIISRKNRNPLYQEPSQHYMLRHHGIIIAIFAVQKFTSQ